MCSFKLGVTKQLRIDRMFYALRSVNRLVKSLRFDSQASARKTKMAAMLGNSTKRMLAHQELASERSAWPAGQELAG